MKHFLLILFFTCNLLSTTAEPHLTRNYAYRYYTTRDGLAQMQVLCAFQDRDGYMWFGTKGGVSRFDGVSFKNYTSENGLPDGEVRTITEWGGKKLIFYSNRIAILYENDKIENVDLPDSLVTENRELLTVDLLDENRILLLDLNIQNHPNSIERNYHLIWNIHTNRFEVLKGFNKKVLDHNGKYFLTEDGLYLRNGLNFKKIARTPQKLEHVKVDWDKLEFYLRDINMTVINKYKFTDNKFQLINKIININILKSGSQFIVLPDSSFLYFDVDNNAHFVPERQTGFGVNLSFLERMYVDREKNLWIATNNGLYNFFNLSVEEVKLNLADPDDIWSVLEDNDYNMWFGSYGNGMWRINHLGELTSELKGFKLSNLQYMGSTKSNDGTMYFPAANGVVKYKKRDSSSLTNTAACLSTYFDEVSKKLFFSGLDSITQNRGLYLETKTERKFFPWKKGFPISIVKDGKGQIRLGAFHGQGIFKDDSIITDIRKHEYEGVICMSSDNKGWLWKGTNKGVYVEQADGTEMRISPLIITGQITSIMVYHDKYVLVGGTHSLFIIDVQHYPTKVNPQTWEIGYEVGFTGLESGQNGFCEDHNGDVWLTTALCVLKFNPEKLVQSQTQLIPPIRLASLWFSKDNTNWNTLFFYNHSIALKSSNKFLRFEYVANSMSAPKSLRFKYRLTGFSDKWSEPTYTKSVGFTNIGYGKYRFEVKCSLDGIHWSPVVQSPTIEIIAPVYFRPVAFITYILLLILLSVHLTRVFLKRNQKKKLNELNRMKLENELQLNTLRSKVIPHFTKNVLSAIGYFSMTDKLKAGHYISLFSEFTQSTLANADKNYITLHEELSYIRNYLELEKMRFGEKFDYRIEISENVSTDLLIPTMTLHTYCDNAIRHGLVHNEGIGKLEIVISTSEDGILITVSDNGIGRKRAEQLGTRGNGQGLKLIQAQLDFYNQVNEKLIVQNIIDLENIDSNPLGTRIELLIPFEYKFM